MLYQVYLWYPLSIVTGGTTAKIMVAAKDNFLGKYIYKDTLDRNLAAVIYKVSFFPIFVCGYVSFYGTVVVESGNFAQFNLLKCLFFLSCQARPPFIWLYIIYDVAV